MGLVSGKLFDMGYFHTTQIVGILIYLISYVSRMSLLGRITDSGNRIFMLSLADFSQYYQLFLAQGLGVGIGIGFLFLPALAIQGHHWKKRRALAMGIVLTGTPILCHTLFKCLHLERLRMRRRCIPHHDESIVHSYYCRLRLVRKDNGLCGYWTIDHCKIADVHEPTPSP